MNIENYISSGIIEQYVLGLCSVEENNEIELLRKQEPMLNKAILEFEIAFEEKMMQGNSLPSSATDASVLETIRALKTPVVAFKKEDPKIVSIGWIKLLAVAAVLLLAVSVFYNYSLYNKNKEQADTIAAISKQPASLPIGDYNILKNPRITPVAMNGVGTHAVCRCTMFWDKNTGKAYVMIHHLMPSGDTKDYQLWATVNGKQVSVGMINDKIRDRFVEVTGMPQGANEFIVTLEKAGGSATPNLEETYLMGKI